MNPIGKQERTTQKPVITLFEEELGYRYLGNWAGGAGNTPIIEDTLRVWLGRQGHPEARIDQAIEKLRRRADKGGRDLYHVNMDVYQLLRYGADVLTGAAEKHGNVFLIDWANPEVNDFAVAEEA